MSQDQKGKLGDELGGAGLFPDEQRQWLEPGVISAEGGRRDRLERDSMVQWAGSARGLDVDEREGEGQERLTPE